MRHNILVVAVVALLTCADHALASDSKVVTPSDLPSPAHELTENWNNAPTKRFLRTVNHAGEDAEERLFGIEKVTEAIKSTSAKMKQSMDLRTWLKEGQSADEVANLLKLDDNVEIVLSNRNFNALAKYISKFNKQNPENKVSMIGVLTRRYGESAVAKMLVAAKNVKSREVWATKLQGDQVAGWINSKKTAIDVFKILNLDDATTNPLITRNLEAWKNFASVLANRDPKQATTMFQTFRKVYKDNGLARLLDTYNLPPGSGQVAHDLKTSLFARWKKGKITTSNINVKVFGLKDGDEIDAVAKRITILYKTYIKTGAVDL